MMSAFANRMVLITGAASGLARAMAGLLAREGARIAAIDLQPEGLDRLVAEHPGHAMAAAVADVTDHAALSRAVAELERQLGPSDLLLASAGVGYETSALDFRAEAMEKLIQVNLIGVSNSIAAVLPGMLDRQRGHLAGVSSLASFRGVPGMAGYCASKAGVNAMLDALRVELRPQGIAVTTLCPGWVRTPMTATVRIPMANLLEADVAARLMIEALRKRRPFYAFPSPSARQMRFLRWLPCGLSDWLVDRAIRRLPR